MPNVGLSEALLVAFSLDELLTSRNGETGASGKTMPLTDLHLPICFWIFIEDQVLKEVPGT